MSKKQKFVDEWNEIPFPKVLVLLVKLPSGIVEVITSMFELPGKFEYILETYDKDLVMYNNTNIRIVDWAIA
jgi:hypothetical protein